MKTKKLLALLMAGAMSVSMLSGCGGSAAKTDDSSADAADTSASAESDIDYVKSNGKLVIGITDFAPMDYKEDGSDEWVPPVFSESRTKDENQCLLASLPPRMKERIAAITKVEAMQTTIISRFITILSTWQNRCEIINRKIRVFQI